MKEETRTGTEKKQGEIRVSMINESTRRKLQEQSQSRRQQNQRLIQDRKMKKGGYMKKKERELIEKKVRGAVNKTNEY